MRRFTSLAHIKLSADFYCPIVTQLCLSFPILQFAYVPVADRKEIVGNHHCVCSFNILNQRQDLAFYFFSNLSMTNGFSNKTYVGRSAQNLTLANPNMPLHGHLALTSTPT